MNFQTRSYQVASPCYSMYLPFVKKKYHCCAHDSVVKVVLPAPSNAISISNTQYTNKIQIALKALHVKLLKRRIVEFVFEEIRLVILVIIHST